MAQSVSNDALWVKLSEVEQKVDRLLVEQKSPVPTQEPAVNKSDSTAVKEEIITKIKNEIRILGLSSDSHFKANTKNIIAITETIQKVWNIVSRIRKQQRESIEPQKTEDSHFNFRFFKVRKTSFVIVILGLLVFILTLFCMKQQNDYALLMDENYKKIVSFKEIQTEVDSLKR